MPENYKIQTSIFFPTRRYVLPKHSIPTGFNKSPLFLFWESQHLTFLKVQFNTTK